MNDSKRSVVSSQFLLKLLHKDNKHADMVDSFFKRKAKFPVSRGAQASTFPSLIISGADLKF